MEALERARRGLMGLGEEAEEVIICQGTPRRLVSGLLPQGYSESNQLVDVLSFYLSLSERKSSPLEGQRAFVGGAKRSP